MFFISVTRSPHQDTLRFKIYALCSQPFCRYKISFAFLHESDGVARVGLRGSSSGWINVDLISMPNYSVANKLIVSLSVAAYFGEVNDVSTTLYIYTACGAGISSTGGAKLQRERPGRKCSSIGHCWRQWMPFTFLEAWPWRLSGYCLLSPRHLCCPYACVISEFLLELPIHRCLALVGTSFRSGTLGWSTINQADHKSAFTAVYTLLQELLCVS
jgi:hypothetical protein